MPAKFHKAVNHNSICLQNTFCFPDDILIVSNGSKEDHSKLVVNLANLANLAVNLPNTFQKKSVLFMNPYTILVIFSQYSPTSPHFKTTTLQINKKVGLKNKLLILMLIKLALQIIPKIFTTIRKSKQVFNAMPLVLATEQLLKKKQLMNGNPYLLLLGF